MIGPVNAQVVSPQVFVVRKGESSASVSRRLAEADLIKSNLAFRFLVYIKGYSGKVQAGSFELSSSQNNQEIMRSLTHGTTDIWLTFPEGWRKEQMADRLKANLMDFDKRDFLDLAQEGYLFPDTYLVPKAVDADQMLKIFAKNFDSKVSPEVAESNLTLNQILTLASLVEREVQTSQDKAMVAGILIKRWQADWPLQIDATLQYAKGTAADWWPKVTGADKKINSSYNTYQHKGLPAGPICNPGLDSIKAVLQPQASNFWFYLSDAQGQTHYAITSEQHSQNIAKYLSPGR